MPAQKISVMFVCLGNICRSPLAHAILQQKVEAKGWSDRIKVDSCGTASYHTGENADPRTQAVAAKHGVPMNHTAKTLRNEHLRDFDHIVVMDNENRRNVEKVDKGDTIYKLHKMRDFDPDGRGLDVPDPWFGGEQGFEDGFHILNRSCEAFLDYLNEEMTL